MKLKALIESGKLDWGDLYFEASDSTGHRCPFTLRPNDFITFAKADIFLPDTRGLVNALSNAKRAIDCQTDSFIIAIGFDPERLDKQLGQSGMKSISLGRKGSIGPLKLRFLESLGVATPAIVARIRQLRNDLEHEYRKPTRKTVGDAIGVAELFVQACGGKMKSICDGVSFGSGVTKVRGTDELAKCFYIHYESQPKPWFRIRFWSHELSAGKSVRELQVQSDDLEFVPLLKLVCQADYDMDMTDVIKAFLSEIGFSVSPRFRVREF